MRKFKVNDTVFEANDIEHAMSKVLDWNGLNVSEYYEDEE
jgi:hypothetical protein